MVIQKYKFLLVLFFSIYFTSQIYSQLYNNSITGYVFDNNTQEPIENVNVYISNTTFGSSTDREGFFIIKSIPPNIHELIVSVIGYKSIEEKIIIKANTDLKKKYLLVPLIYETQSIDITSSTPEEWLNNFDTFKDIFLGKTFRAENCKIENPEIIDFKENDNNVLSASISQPLIIKNDILGYKIYCNTLKFSYDKVKQIWNWKIKPHYEELSTADSIKANTQNLNRKIAYFGSMYHFFVSLKNKNLTDNGFHVSITDQSGITSSTRHHGLYLIDFTSLIKPGIFENSNIINFDKYLYIQNNEVEDYFSELNNYDCEYGEIFQKSWMKLKYGQMTIDEYGYPMEENPFIVHGYWAKLGVADLLPRYFSLHLDNITNKDAEN